MKLCIRTDVCGNDPQRVTQYCLGLGEDQLFSIPEFADGYGADGLMQPARLQAYHEQWRRHGLHLRLVTETITDEDVISETARRARTDRIRSVLTAMQAAEVEALFLFLNVGAGKDEDEHEARWSGLARIYRDIVSHAELTGRRIASHGHQAPEYLVFAAADMERLLAAAPSPCNGLTFCTGCHDMAGDDLCQWLERFGTDKLFLVHMRDVRRRAHGGFEDTRFGGGEVDLMGVINRLRDMGYRGLVCPEHLPRLPYEPFEEISTACAVGYLRALLEAAAACP